MTTDAPQAETSPNRQLFLESCTTRGTSSEKENLLSGGRLNEPVVQIKPKPNPRLWRKTPNQSHDPLEDLRSRGETKQRAKNWKTLPNAMSRRKYPEYGCIGKSRNTSFRMMYLAHKSEKFNIGRHDPKDFPI